MGHCWTKLKWKRLSLWHRWLFKHKIFTCGDDENEQNPQVEPARENKTHITTRETWEAKLTEASTDGKIVVVNFSASRCSQSRKIAPTYSKLADKYPSFVFLTLDVDEVPELSASWEIKATPTFLFLKDRQQLDKVVGANIKELQKRIAAIAEQVVRSHN